MFCVTVKWSQNQSLPENHIVIIPVRLLLNPNSQTWFNFSRNNEIIRLFHYRIPLSIWKPGHGLTEQEALETLIEKSWA